MPFKPVAATPTPVASRARVRPTPQVASAPVPDTANPWYIPSGARPLGVLQKTHNGFDPKGTNLLPDPRFKPLLIIMNPAHKKQSTQCKSGHPRVPGERTCKKCRRATELAYRIKTGRKKS